MRWGSNKEYLLKLEEQGENIPALQATPELRGYLIPYWQAFNILSPSRQIGLGVGAIPLSEIEAYIRLYEITDSEEKEELLYFIREMDGVFLKHHKKDKGTQNATKQ